MAGACQVTTQLLALLFAGETVGQPLAGGTAIDVLGRDINEVLFAEAAGSLGTGGLWLRQCHGDAGLSELIALSRAISSFSFMILSLKCATFASGTASTVGARRVATLPKAGAPLTGAKVL